MSALSRIAHEWAERCFGRSHVFHMPLRTLRTVEEAIELCQAFGVPKEKVIQAVETVYSRPAGEAEQEIGGVLLTVAILCESMGVEADALLERELTRVLAKSPKHFAERNQEKLDLGLSAGYQPAPTPGQMSSAECTRQVQLDGTKHVCVLDGPCNGFPRIEWQEGEQMKADRMRCDRKILAHFEQDTCRVAVRRDAFFEREFQRWALIKIRRNEVYGL